MNASNTMIRKATELDVGSRIVVGGAIRTVVRVHDLRGCNVSIVLDNGCAIIDRCSTLYTCVCN